MIRCAHQTVVQDERNDAPTRPSSGKLDRRICVAPMMEWTDRHCRYFLRGFSPRVLLYTEMITAAAILRGDRERLLGFDPEEHPVALQLGGNDPDELAAAARIGAEYGYDEINLNCGCPSDRVADGSFGACLMAKPQRVAECVAAMRAAVDVPVTVKLRIGIVDGRQGNVREAIARFDESDYAALHEFVETLHGAGCEVFIVHARKAVLGGFSPKDNREVPPLRYEVVRRLRADFPQLTIVVNGGFRQADAVIEALEWCDGVMLGREAYHRPMVLAEIARVLYPEDVASMLSREEMIDRMVRYAAHRMACGDRLAAITRHMLGLCAGEPGAREYRHILSEGARVADAGPDLIRQAFAACGGRAMRGVESAPPCAGT